MNEGRSKAAETRRQNEIARKNKRAELENEKRIIREAMLSVLSDPSTSSEKKLEAGKCLIEIQKLM